MEQDTEGTSKGDDKLDFDEAVSLVLMNYGQITLAHFTSSFRDGGLTEKQFQALFRTCVVCRHRNYQMLASFQGIELPDLNEDSTRRSSRKDADSVPSFVSSSEAFVFKDPKEYEGMTDEQREALTDMMRGNHKRWVEDQNAKSKV